MNPKNPSDAPKSEQSLKSSGHRSCQITTSRSAVRPDAPKSPASKDARSPETSARHGAKVQDICPERQDSAVRPSDSFKKMEIVNTKKLTEPEWELLMKALDIEKPYKCQFCGKEVKYPEMGLFPPKIIICGSVICVSEALGEVERNGAAP